MIDHDLESAFCAVLKADDQLSAVHFFSGLDDENHKLPAVTVISKSETLAGSAEVFRAELEFRIEHHAKDHTPDEHAAIVGRVRALLGAKTDMLAALNAGSSVQVCGYAVAGSGQETDGEKFLTMITVKAG